MKIKKFLSMFLASITLFGVLSATACKKDEEENSEEVKEENNNVQESITQTDNALLHNGACDYKIVYDPYELGMEDLAEDFAESIEEECDTELELLEYSYAKKEKYRIFVGKISSASESNKEVKALTDKCGKTVSAFSIKFSDNTLMVSGVKKQDVKRALTTLLSYIKNGEFKLKEDFSLTQFSLPIQAVN